MHTLLAYSGIRTALLAGLSLLLVGSGFMAHAEEVPSIDCNSSTHPILAIRGDDISRYPDGRPADFTGFSDPCIRRDPDTGHLWLAYSAPLMQHMGGGPHDYTVGVETHLASSTNGGDTWKFEKVLWPRTPAFFPEAKSGDLQEGFLSHEVPTLARCKVEDKTFWVGACLDYFLPRKGNYQARDNMSFCIRLMTAPTVPELSTTRARLTFGHDKSTPTCNVDYNFCEFSEDFPSTFIPNEPCLTFHNGRLYLTFVCMTFWGKFPDFKKSFVAVFSAAPHGPISHWVWHYHGKLASYPEARELGGEALTQIEIARGNDGKLLAFLTPESWHPRDARRFGDVIGGIHHHGCVVLEIADLKKPSLKRGEDGRLIRRAWLHSSKSPEHGPAAVGYDPACSTGILYTLRKFTPASLTSQKNMSWSLHPTRFHP